MTQTRMPSLFVDADRASVLARIAAIGPGSTRRWGRMDAAQALAHCTVALEGATGDRPISQAWIGKILGPIFRSKLLGPAPFDRDAPTAKSLLVEDPRDLPSERDRLSALVTRFAELGPAHAEGRIHGFLGRLSGDEWGRLMWKHIDHHLQQFGC